MCGIAGVFDVTGRAPADRPLVHRMLKAMEHRGPDGTGFHFEPGLGLGHLRLAVIDLHTGDQPLFNEDGTVCVVFNGEIYNFQELRRELAGKGHVFRTSSDTEVIVHGWEEWGEACVERFNGMFAFALWDSVRETLFLARDRLGEKPLYYTRAPDGRVLFASELKGLLCDPTLRAAIDVRSVEDFFAYGYVPDPRTIYEGIAKLPPAHTLSLRRGDRRVEPRRYWDVSFGEIGRFREEEIREELVLRLREAVRLRLASDVPLGAFLSGGVDSSAVVAMMAQLSPEPVETFSIGFGDRKFDESRHAESVARLCRTHHRARQVDPDETDIVDRLPGIFDEPFADSSAIPTYRVCAMARENVTVALSGDGGDEVFGGYRRYKWHCIEERVRRLLPLKMRAPLFQGLGRAYPKLDWAPQPLRAKATLLGLSRSTAAAYFASVSVCNDDVRTALFSPSMRRELQGYAAREVLDFHMARAGTDDALAQAQYADMQTYLPGDILTKVDRTSMASSLEVRVPLLDHTFVEWASLLPSALKLGGGEGKRIFKSALETVLPRETLYRRKQGFSVPLARWFREELRGELRSRLLHGSLGESGFFDARHIARLVDQHQSGLSDHAAVLWSLWAFEGFLTSAGAGRRGMPAAASMPTIDAVH